MKNKEMYTTDNENKIDEIKKMLDKDNKNYMLITEDYNLLNCNLKFMIKSIVYLINNLSFYCNTDVDSETTKLYKDMIKVLTDSNCTNLDEINKMIEIILNLVEDN